jgi:3-hydroxyacyl-CoA dehydrogenase
VLQPEILKKIDENKWYGDKSQQGFYKKTKNDTGQTEILSLNLSSLLYGQQQKVKFTALDQTKVIEELKPRFSVLIKSADKAGQFYRRTFLGLFKYASNRIPEISDELYRKHGMLLV